MGMLTMDPDPALAGGWPAVPRFCSKPEACVESSAWENGSRGIPAVAKICGSRAIISASPSW